MTLDKLGYALLAVGLLVLLYGLLGGPAAQVGLIAIGVGMGLIGGALILVRGHETP